MGAVSHEMANLKGQIHSYGDVNMFHHVQFLSGAILRKLSNVNDGKCVRSHGDKRGLSRSMSS